MLSFLFDKTVWCLRYVSVFLWSTLCVGVFTPIPSTHSKPRLSQYCSSCFVITGSKPGTPPPSGTTPFSGTCSLYCLGLFVNYVRSQVNVEFSFRQNCVMFTLTVCFCVSACATWHTIVDIFQGRSQGWPGLPKPPPIALRKKNYKGKQLILFTTFILRIKLHSELQWRRNALNVTCYQ